MSSSSVPAVSPGAAAQVSNINLQDFLQILSTQLTNQDPLKPMDDQEFLAQIAQFSTLEQSAALNATVNQMFTVQSVAQTVGLIGQTVTVNPTTATGSQIVGQVTALNYVSGQVQLTVTPANG
ncbi:MAG TPA: flagellar hook capping FlgD N-terminal domain-containing protein, partial [Burkholderiaceae bacterium]|nr:flagellar hook capping FlgD N-terminal domain-containing protein [Burkholderiaceae bacterium]